MSKRLTIGFLSLYSPDDKKSSSGTNYKMVQELRKIGDLKWIPIQYTAKRKLLSKLVNGWNRIFPKHIYLDGTNFGIKNSYKLFSAETFNGCDIIVAFFCMPCIPNIITDKPIIYFTDTTGEAMIDYYPHFSNLFSFNKKQLIENEKKAMDKASAIVLSSKWAANSAINKLGQPKDKIHIFEFGANIEDTDTDKISRNLSEKINIIFIGVDWKRKGGDIAVEAVKWLNDNGIDANLHIVGIKQLPKEIIKYPFIHNHGFLNKNNRDEYVKIIELYKKANCLLLPTIAECAGIVFSEASAYGIPVFTHDTGGISNYVINGVNGYRLPLGSTGIDFGKKIKECINTHTIDKMSIQAQSLYKERLNWNLWGLKVSKLIDSLVL